MSIYLKAKAFGVVNTVLLIIKGWERADPSVLFISLLNFHCPISPRKDIFDEPFDDGTLAKLAIYTHYLKEWAPVFLAKKVPIWKTIQIFDFCAGRGNDGAGVKGSPLVAIEELNKWCEHIATKNLTVRLVLSEPRKKYFDHLTEVIKPLIRPQFYTSPTHQKEFEQLFEEEYPSMKGAANLVFIDQNGIKMITKEVFAQIIDLSQTDLLFFISSSFFTRFSESDAFRQYIQIDKKDIEENKYHRIHQTVFNYYKNLIPANKNYYLAPFSIKKGSNIYGLIYGSNHTLGIEKFLSVCWKMDEQRGTANFDVDDDRINPSAPSLFEEFNVPKKIQVFEQDIEELILAKKITTNRQLYHYALLQGFQPAHANKKIEELKRDKKIGFDFSPVKNNIHKIEVQPIKIL